SLKYDTELQQAVLKTSHGRRAAPSSQAGQKGGFFSKMKNVFNRPKNADVPVSASNSTTGRLGTASRAAQQQQQNTAVGAPLGSTARRPVTAQKRP
ncbi:unnamed protein product, partial [Adineta steineri]